MSLTTALASSVSGLETASTQISVIGDNIANANTTGFKEKRAEFSSVLGQSITAGSGFAQVGSGAKVNDVGTIFTQGVFDRTQRTTDLAIEGRGFFVLEGNAGRSYTRAGLFGFDSTGLLVDANDNRIQGFGIDPVTNQPNGVLGDIQVNLPLSPPQATASIQLGMNLDATAVAIPGGFDPANAGATSNAREVVTIYDSLGTARQATVFFTKTAANSWDYNMTLADADSGTPTGDPFVVQGGLGSGTLAFDGTGSLISINGGNTDPAITFDLSTANGAIGAQAVTFSMGPIVGSATTGPVSTQFNQSTATNFTDQDGFAPGELSFLEIDADGLVNGVFTNGETLSLAQVALANFGNVEGLTDIGGSRLLESVESGAAIVAGANSGSLGSIRSASLEKSNVDLASQFVNLIVAQRAFQANTRTVSVASELMANLVALGQ